jgi:hypothetical protein
VEGFCLNASNISYDLSYSGDQVCVVVDEDGVAVTRSEFSGHSSDLFGVSVTEVRSSTGSAADLCGPFITSSGSYGYGTGGLAGGTDRAGNPLLVTEGGVGYSVSGIEGVPGGLTGGKSNTTHVYHLGNEGHNDCTTYLGKNLH